MLKFMVRAPGWLIAVICGGLFALVVVVVGVIDHEPARFVAITALAGGTILGTVVALATRKQRREQRRMFETVPEDDWKQVRRAVWKGPVPTEPRIRAAALDLANQYFGRAYRFRKALYIILGVNIVLQILSLVFGGSRWAVFTLGFMLCAFASHWYNLRRLKRRIEVLQPH
ncbi:hypothetical protein ACI2LF_11660 [Kribbella sp. NPDC020789]